MPSCKKGQQYRVRQVQAADGGYIVTTDEGAVFGLLERPSLAAGDLLVLGATCAGWTQIGPQRQRARVLKEPDFEPEVAVG